MTVFLTKQLVERNSLFQPLFYRLFVLVSIMDSLYFVIVTFGIKWPQFGLFGGFYARNSWLSFVSKLSASYLDMLDVLLNATIAFNRYCVVASGKRQHIWRGRYLAVILLVVFVLPLLIIAPLFDNRTFYFKSDDDDMTICMRTKNGDIVEQDGLANILGVTFTVLLVSFSLGMDAKTAFSYRKATRELVGVSHKADMQLLTHSVAVTIVLAINTVVQIIRFADGEESSDTIILVTLLLSDIRMAIGPVFLFVVSPTVRYAYMEFYGLARRRKGSVLSVNSMSTAQRNTPAWTTRRTTVPVV
ncbi:hypothetical protein AAVH_26044 [Aphelenchoides avenae]|nr:hypothetical protein AAVH_26044 [Aphelenchus avenae]